MYNSDGLSSFSSYLKQVLLPYVKPGSRLFPLLKKKLRVWQSSQQFTSDHELAPPLPAFPAGDVNGKVWSTLITTQQTGVHPKSSLGFAIYCVNSPAPIYWRIALCVFSPYANILALRVLSVNTFFEVYQLPQTKRCQLLPSKRCNFWLKSFQMCLTGSIVPQWGLSTDKPKLPWGHQALFSLSSALGTWLTWIYTKCSLREK